MSHTLLVRLGFFAQRIAVGTPITERPPHRTYVRNSRIRLPPWVFDAEALSGPGVRCPGLGQPALGQLFHAFPRRAISLATPAQGASPEIDDIVAKRREGACVGGHRMVREETSHHSAQPLPCSAMSRCQRRRRSSLISRSSAIFRSRRVWRANRSPPRLDREQIWVKPRKSKVSGLPAPRAARSDAACLPNSIRRVLPGCNGSVANFQSGQAKRRKSDYLIPPVNRTAALGMVRLSAVTNPSGSCASVQSRQASQRRTRRI
jgi:hypothetical protein